METHTLNLTKSELTILTKALTTVSFQGKEGMKIALELMDKLEKASGPDESSE